LVAVVAAEQVKNTDHPISVQIGFAHRPSVRLGILDFLDRSHERHQLVSCLRVLMLRLL
jgi:hypothetical protein